MWGILSAIVVLLFLFGAHHVAEHKFNIKKSWQFEVTMRLISYIIGPLPVFVILYEATGEFTFALSLSVIFFIGMMTLALFYRFILQKPHASTRYRLPLVERKGTVIEKRAGSCRREWIILSYTENKQLGVYLPYSGTGEGRIAARLNIGDTGTLYYRKGKKHNYFEDFEKSEPDITSVKNG